MADFPTTQPPDIAEINAYIRYWLANIDENIITDADMNVMIAMNIGKYGTDLCKITYYSTIDVLRWLIRSGAKGTAGSVGSGAISRIKEKVGRKEKEVYYDVGTSTGEASGWDRVLEDLLESPSSIGCNPIDSSTSQSMGSVIIGGAEVNGAESVYESRMRRDKASYDYRSPTNFPWRPSRY